MVTVLGVNTQYWQYTSDGFRFDDISEPNMSFSQTPFGGFSLSGQTSYPPPIQSPPGQVMPSMIGATPMMGSQPPEWAIMLINDVKMIKTQVSKIESIEKNCEHDELSN